MSPHHSTTRLLAALLTAGVGASAWAAAPLVITKANTFGYSGSYTSTDTTTPAITITATSGTVVLQNCSAQNTNQNSTVPAILIQPATQSTAKIYIKNCTIGNSSLAANGGGAAAVGISPLAGEVYIQGRASSSSYTNSLYPCIITSANPGAAAIQVDSPSPVSIQKCSLSAKGSHIASATYGRAKLTVSDNKVKGLNPGVASQPQGRFIRVLAPQSLTVTRNRIENTAGIYVNGHGETGHVIGDNIVITHNDVLNINGRLSDGAQGYQTSRELVQFVQLDKVLANPGKSILISWNQVINQIGNSAVEDIINIGSSSGSASYPIRVSNNYLQGGYPTVLTAGFSGCGIVTDTAPGGLVTHHVAIDSNQVVDTVNCGIGIATGHHITATSNRLIGENRAPDGTLIAAANVGLYMMNSQNLDAALFATNSSTNNLSGWMGWRHATPSDIIRNDYYFASGCANPACDASNASHVPTGGSAWTALPPGTSAAEFQRWQQKLTGQQMKVGPTW